MLIRFVFSSRIHTEFNTIKQYISQGDTVYIVEKGKNVPTLKLVAINTEDAQSSTEFNRTIIEDEEPEAVREMTEEEISALKVLHAASRRADEAADIHWPAGGEDRPSLEEYRNSMREAFGSEFDLDKADEGYLRKWGGK